MKIRTVYPCCGGESRLVAIDLIPREKYERRCPNCGTRWTVERNRIRESADVVVDRLDWEREE